MTLLFFGGGRLQILEKGSANLKNQIRALIKR